MFGIEQFFQPLKLPTSTVKVLEQSAVFTITSSQQFLEIKSLWFYVFGPIKIGSEPTVETDCFKEQMQLTLHRLCLWVSYDSQNKQR
jgi:hypothetical protein